MGIASVGIYYTSEQILLQVDTQSWNRNYFLFNQYILNKLKVPSAQRTKN